MKKLVGLLLLFTATVSCTKPDVNPVGSFLAGSGVFILNEGNFRAGNGSLSFYSYDSLKIYNDIFSEVNGRPLGDVPNSMKIFADNAYIVVNNSGKIEVINTNTLESIKTISGLIAPRNISFVNENKAYVTSMYSDSVIIINLSDNSISGYINMRRSSESIEIVGTKAFISNWVGGDEIMVVSTINDRVIDSIEVGVEPESMVVDRNFKLWVLCNGGWERNNFAELYQINTIGDFIERKLVFPTKQASPSCLQIGDNKETMYYIENGVHQVSIDASELSATPLIPQTNHYFYKIGINPLNSDIFITDAVDYQKRGYVLLYGKDGSFISTLDADIIPGLMCFKLNDDFLIR
jgi:hypothetical protein